jgi:hypothetical protein
VKRRRNQVVQHVEPIQSAERPPPVDRWLASVDLVQRDVLLTALRSGYQLQAVRVPTPLLPAAVLLGCYARNYEGVELFDDYDTLVDLLDHALSAWGSVQHPDLYLASCARLLHKRHQIPDRQVFEELGFHEIFQAVITVEHSE